MKTITESELENTIAHIIYDSKERAKLRKEPFVGLIWNEVLVELQRKLGDDWALIEDRPVQLTKDDFSAVANSRFFRKTGGRLLIWLAAMILGLAVLTLTIPLIPPNVYYVVISIITISFFWYYSKKQREARRNLGAEFRKIGIDIGQDK